MKKIFVMGSLNMDVSFDVEALPKNGETVDSRNLLVNPGGKGANQAVAAARQNAEVIMLGAVGYDQFGDRLIEELEKNDVETKFMVRKNCHTGMAAILLHEGDNRIVIHGGANRMYEFADFAHILRKEARKGDIFIAQLETELKTVLSGLSLARELELTTVLNPAPAFKEATEALKYCDIVIPNETETEILVNEFPCEANYESIGRKFANYGVNTVILTCGARGSVLIRDKITPFDACKVDVADTTASGDTYIGAFAAKLASGEGFESALNYATAASALAVTSKGSLCSIPYAKEVNEFMRRKNASGSRELPRPRKRFLTEKRV